ncbi:MAG: hypothetical protein WAM17_13355, partial [Rhodoplanes sp.]
MGGFRHRSLHIELENGLRATGTLLGQPPPAGMAHARRAVATQAVANEIDVDILVGRPMALEIVEEGGPVGLQAMPLEVAQRKRKAVVDADQCGLVFGQLVYQPFGDTTSRPVFLQGWRWQNLDRRCIPLGQIDAQAFETRSRRLRARIIDADVSGECGTSRHRLEPLEVRTLRTITESQSPILRGVSTSPEIDSILNGTTRSSRGSCRNRS